VYVDDRYEAFIAADPTFYDVLHSSKAETGNFSLGERELPPGWDREERDDWIVMRRPETVLAVQGWKIHASSCMDNAERVLEKVWNYCVPRKISFKFLRSQGALLGRVSKYAARGFSGKLVWRTTAVLDEATCHLDPAAEAVVELAFAARPGALVVIAHRLGSALRARRILVLDGQTATLGDQDSLMECSELYRKLMKFHDHFIDPPRPVSHGRSVKGIVAPRPEPAAQLLES